MKHLHLFALALMVAVPSGAEPQFFGETEISIKGLPLGSYDTPLSVEEPHVRVLNGQTLLFFSSNRSEGNRDLHYAKWESGEFAYKGSFGANTPFALEGAPSSTSQGFFYYTDSQSPVTISVGIFVPIFGLFSKLNPLIGLPPYTVINGMTHLNMDVEISGSGKNLYFSRGVFPSDDLANEPAPIACDIHYAQMTNPLFVNFNPVLSAFILQNVNTDRLEYAPALSGNELELYYTSTTPTTIGLRSAILVATRPAIGLPFGAPTAIAAIGDRKFVEGPTLTPDGSWLLYHKYVGPKFKLFGVKRR